MADPVIVYYGNAVADNDAVNKFADLMKGKLAIARKKGRDGWQEMSEHELWQCLRGHVNKGDPVDVANFAMFIAMNRLRGEV